MSITQLIFLGVDLRVFPFLSVCSVVKRPAVILLLLKSCFGITIATWKVLLYSDIRLDIVVRSSEDIFKLPKQIYRMAMAVDSLSPEKKSQSFTLDKTRQ